MVDIHFEDAPVAKVTGAGSTNTEDGCDSSTIRSNDNPGPNNSIYTSNSTTSKG